MPPSDKGHGLLRSVSWNYLGYIAEFVAGFLLLGYVLRRVPVEDYGIYLLALSVTGFLYLLDCGLSNILIQLYVGVFTSKGILEVNRLASSLFVAMLGGWRGGSLHCQHPGGDSAQGNRSAGDANCSGGSRGGDCGIHGSFQSWRGSAGTGLPGLSSL
jgi:hypothetical protein